MISCRCKQNIFKAYFTAIILHCLEILPERIVICEVSCPNCINQFFKYEIILLFSSRFSAIYSLSKVELTVYANQRSGIIRI